MKDREASEICAFFPCAILWSHRFVGSFQRSLFLSHFMAWPSWINCKNVILDVIVVLICLQRRIEFPTSSKRVSPISILHNGSRKRWYAALCWHPAS